MTTRTDQLASQTADQSSDPAAVTAEGKVSADLKGNAQRETFDGPENDTRELRQPLMGEIVIIRSLDDGTEAPAIVNGVRVEQRQVPISPSLVSAGRPTTLPAPNAVLPVSEEVVSISAVMFPAGQAVRSVDNVRLYGTAQDASLVLAPAPSRHEHLLVAFWPGDNGPTRPAVPTRTV